MSSAGPGGQCSMTTMTPLDLAATARETSRLVEGVRDDQLADPTPCADTSVAALLDHLHGLAVGLRLAAEKRPTGAPSASADALPEDWRRLIPRELEELA